MKYDRQVAILAATNKNASKTEIDEAFLTTSILD
jgi:hypothetical protein